MRKLFPMLAVAGLFSAFILVAQAAEEKTVKGEGQCAKCSLKETKSCQNAIVADEGGKKVTYYIKHDAVGKKFHKNVCTEKKTVKATGDVEKIDGKLVMTVKDDSKIEVVED